MLFIGNAQVNRQNKGGKIDQNRVSLSRYLPLSALPLIFIRKVCGEVSDDLNPERKLTASEADRMAAHRRVAPGRPDANKTS